MLQAVSDEARDEDPEEDVSEVSSPASLLSISLLSPKAMETAGQIIRFAAEQQDKAKVRHNITFACSVLYMFFCMSNEIPKFTPQLI